MVILLLLYSKEFVCWKQEVRQLLQKEFVIVKQELMCLVKKVVKLVISRHFLKEQDLNLFKQARN